MRNWLGTVLIVGLLLGLALLAGWLLNERNQNDPRQWAEAEAIRQESARKQQEAAYFLPIRLVVGAGLGTVLVVGAGLAVRVVYLWGCRRARTIYPDRHGVLPAAVLQPGEILVDTGALAGPLVVGAAGPEYRLPPAAIPQLQSGANQGAAMTRTMRAWATQPARPAAHSTAAGTSFRLLSAQEPWPSVEQLTGDENEILRLLEQGRA